ncbi:MAG: glutathione S-transferase family protein [Gammaproteobacteria bacterium]
MLKLYSYPESGNSYKVRLLLSFLALPHEIVDVDLMSDEQHGAAYLAINPRGEVPALRDGELLLRDSAAILVYLASTHGPDPWYPREPRAMAAITEWLAFAASWIQYGVFTARALVAFGIPANGLPPGFPANLDEARVRGARSLEILDAELKTRPWLTGERPSIADIANFPYVALAPMGGIALEPYPAVLAWIARFRALPGFIPIAGLDDPQYRKAGTPSLT